MALTLEDILKADDIKSQPVEVPEWGGQVYVRTYTVKERDAVLKLVRSAAKKENYADVGLDVVILSTHDEHGNKMFTEDHRAALNAKSGTALDRIVLAALELNGMTEKAVEEKKGN